jgi:hypothetical protein
MHIILKRLPVRHIFILLLAVALSGCMRVQVDGAWEADVSRDQSFRRILVIGLSPNAGSRCDFESFMATQIRAAGTDASPSCNLMKTSEPLTLESIHAAVVEYGADAVFTTMLVGSEVGAKEGGERETRGGIYVKATGTGYANYYRGGYGRYGVPVVYGEFRKAPVITSLDGKVRIQSMLYATSDKSLVYKLGTTAKDLSSRDNALASVTPLIAKRLQRAGLLAPAQPAQ